MTGTGTGGTLTGVARVLRAKSPSTKIIVAEPENSPVLAGGSGQAYNTDGTPAASSPLFRPHPVQGWSPDFVPHIVHSARAEGLIDHIQPIASAEALRLARDLARREGIFCGISAGATLAAALEIARSARSGSRILFMVPDTGERYLSTVLFEDIGQEMSAEERALSDSTPFGRFGVPQGPATNTQIPAEAVPERARAFVSAAIADAEVPVTLFALEWCEFSWSARRFLRDLGVRFRSVDLGSVVMQRSGLGGDIRVDLRQRIGSRPSRRCSSAAGMWAGRWTF